MSSRVLAGIVMFLTFFGWGVFLVPMSSYVEKLFGASAIGWAYGMGPLAAMVSPLVAGWLADRSYSPAKLLAVSLLLSGVALAFLPQAESKTIFYLLLFIHSLCFFASLPILNSLVMSRLSDPGREFGVIRLFGTIGWIVSGLVVAYVLGIRFYVGDLDQSTGLQPLKFLMDAYVSSKPIIFYAGALSLALAAFAAFLFGDAKVVGSDSKGELGGSMMSLFKDSQFAIFLLFSFLISIPLALYYSFANIFLKSVKLSGTEAFMTWGQVSEVVFLALLPFFASRFTAKFILLVGIACWALRYWLFADFPTVGAALFLAIILHGACYDFFFVAGTLYANKKAPQGLKNTAQSVVVWVTLGLGMAVGQIVLAPVLADLYISKAADGSLVFAREFWLYPSLFALGLLVVFALVFRDDTRLSDAKE
jgi:nucleoside transporter